VEMRRHILRAVLTVNSSLRAPVVVRPQIRCLHATLPVLKKSKLSEDKHNKKGKQKDVQREEDTSAGSSGIFLLRSIFPASSMN
jgi:hypothetical protein